MGRLVRATVAALAIGTGSALAVVLAPAPAAHVHAHPQYKYVCPMACEESDKPGKCSVCGMTLKKVAVDHDD
jgi:hypothetical protein